MKRVNNIDTNSFHLLLTLLPSQFDALSQILKAVPFVLMQAAIYVHKL